MLVKGATGNNGVLVIIYNNTRITYSYNSRYCNWVDRAYMLSEDYAFTYAHSLVIRLQDIWQILWHTLGKVVTKGVAWNHKLEKKNDGIRYVSSDVIFHKRGNERIWISIINGSGYGLRSVRHQAISALKFCSVDCFSIDMIYLSILFSDTLIRLWHMNGSPNTLEATVKGVVVNYLSSLWYHDNAVNIII